MCVCPKSCLLPAAHEHFKSDVTPEGLHGEQCERGAYVNGMVAATGDDHLLPGWRCMQLLRVLCGPVQQGNVASTICVVLLGSIHLHAHTTDGLVKYIGSYTGHH